MELFNGLLESLKSSPDLTGKKIKGVPYFYDKQLHKEMTVHIGAAKYMSRMSRAFAHPDHSPAFFEYNGIKYGVKPL